MTKSEKNKMLTTNTYLWIAAMILPAICYFGFASTRFPWPVIIPFLLTGALLTSNKMLSGAIGEPTDDSATEKQK